MKLVKQHGAMVTHIARDLDTEQMRTATLNQPGAWRRQGHAGHRCAAQSAAKVERLQRELSRVTTKRDILTKRSATLQGTCEEYAFIVRHRDVSTTREICRVMNVSVSGFYEWFGGAASERILSNATLMRSIRKSFELSDRTYRSPRVWHDLRPVGGQCDVNHVVRPMELANLQARRKRRRLSGDGATKLENHIAPNHLHREFGALKSNQQRSPTSKPDQWCSLVRYLAALLAMIIAERALSRRSKRGSFR